MTSIALSSPQFEAVVSVEGPQEPQEHFAPNDDEDVEATLNKMLSSKTKKTYTRCCQEFYQFLSSKFPATFENGEIQLARITTRQFEQFLVTKQRSAKSGIHHLSVS